ncbi:serine hydrolase [Corynebacterium sp. c8Ua_181]|uniref:Serine hydrolase n=1 Tax=Corynebacterium curieae TaxID=2913500 RepID=A0A9X3MAH5_9CORY|nr:serine hydrolase [Corynebacterium curieae]MCZ9307184.1 serine hydrolase [Corynebacterium curieae]
MKRILACSLAAALASGPPLALAETPTAPTTTRTAAPDTDKCPHSERPEKATTTSERLAPGQASPTPLPPVDSDEPCGTTLPEGFKVDKDVVAAAWMVSDIDTGEIVAMKDPNGRYRPASIIKALLALVVIDELDLHKKVEVSEESVQIDGSAVGIGPGGDYTVEQLLQGLLMASGNDAAHALAQEMGGDEATLRKVNEKAAEIGTNSTYAASYSGLDAPGMSTSAEDISRIYRAAFHNPTFARIVDTESVDFPGWGDFDGYQLGNDNGLFLNDPDGIGGKTGFTDDAHHTFVGALDRHGRRLQAVLLDTTVEHGPRAWEQAQKLLHEAYKVPPGSGVGNLLADATSPAATPEPDSQTQSVNSSLAGVQGWLGWVIAGAVVLLAMCVGAFSLLRR